MFSEVSLLSPSFPNKPPTIISLTDENIIEENISYSNSTNFAGSFSYFLSNETNSTQKVLVWKTINNEIHLSEISLNSINTISPTVILQFSQNILKPGLEIVRGQYANEIIIYLLTNPRKLHRLSLRLNEGSLLKQLTTDTLIKETYSIHSFSSVFSKPIDISCLNVIDLNTIVIGFSNGNIIRVIRNENTLRYEENTYLFDHQNNLFNSAFSLWNNILGKTKTQLSEVLSVKNILIHDNSQLFVALCKDGLLHFWNEDISSKVLLQVNINEDEDQKMSFCSNPLQIVLLDDVVYCVVAYTSEDINYLDDDMNINNRITKFKVLKFTISDDDNFIIEYDGVENEKFFTSNNLPENLNNNNNIVKLHTFTIVNGYVWTIWLVNSASIINNDQESIYFVAYGSLLQSNQSFVSQPWNFIRSNYSQLSSKFPNQIDRNSLMWMANNQYSIQDYVMEHLFNKSSIFSQQVLFETILEFYPKDEIPTLFDLDKKPILITQEELSYAVNKTISQRKISNQLNEFIEGDVFDEYYNTLVIVELEYQVWREFYEKLIKCWVRQSTPIGFLLPENNEEISSSIGLIHSNDITLFRPCDVIENLWNDPKGSQSLVNTVKSPKDQTPNFEDLLQFIELVKCITNTSIGGLTELELTQQFTSALRRGEDPSNCSKTLALYLISGLTDNTDMVTTIRYKDFIKDFFQRLYRIKTPLNSLLDWFVEKLSSIDELPIISNGPLSPINPRDQMESDNSALLSLDNDIVKYLISTSCIQIVETRYEFTRNLCILIDILKNLKLNDLSSKQVNLKENELLTIKQQLDYKYSSRLFSLVKAYFTLHWLSNRYITSYVIDDLQTYMEESKLNLSEFLGMKKSKRREGYFFEMLLRDKHDKKVLMEELQRVLSIEPLRNISISSLITRLSYLLISNIWVEQEVDDSQLHAIEVAQKLFNWEQFYTLKEYAQLIKDDVPHVKHFYGLCHLQDGEALKAKDLFTEVGIAISNIEYKNLTLKLFTLLHTYWKVEPNNVLINDKYVMKAPVFYYYNSIRQICDRHPDLALEFTNLSLCEIDKTNVIPKEEINILYSVLFNYNLLFERFDSAYQAFMCNSDPIRKLNDLRKFIGMICETKNYSLLCNYSFINHNLEVNDILHERAKNSDIYSDENGDVHSASTYYQLLYSFNIHRGDYNKACLFMYEFARRIRKESHHADIKRLEWCLKKQSECYLIALNSLKLVSKENQWILYPNEDDQQSNLKRARFYEQSNLLLDGTNDNNQIIPAIITAKELEQEYQLVISKLVILKHKSSQNITFIQSPSDISTLLADCEEFEKAFQLCKSFELEDKNIIFIKITEKCIHTNHPKDWKYLERSLEKYDNRDTGYQFAATCIKTILQTSIPLPGWLVNLVEPNTLARIYLEFGKKIPEAIALIGATVPTFTASTQPPMMRIPLTLTMTEYIEQ
ncbi:hypothetical protein ABK040_000168 [Willaertia magna]